MEQSFALEQQEITSSRPSPPSTLPLSPYLLTTHNYLPTPHHPPLPTTDLVRVRANPNPNPNPNPTPKQEIAISQLQGRLRDLSAYQAVLSAGGAPAHSPARAAAAGGRGGAGARGRGGGGSAAGGGGAGREELDAVVEKMTRVIERLQANPNP